MLKLNKYILFHSRHLSFLFFIWVLKVLFFCHNDLPYHHDYLL
jgi:hypothetical protein